jgi:hypothetical protein
MSPKQSIREGRSKGETDIHKGATAHIDAWASHLAVINGERAQTTDANRALEPERPFEAHAAAKTKIKTAQIEAHLSGARILASPGSRPAR